ncbi:MAG: histidine phosphatase family protein [bacterium]
MKIILVRHGESEGNISNLIQGGMSKINLTVNGCEQAKKLAEKLHKVKVDLAFVSPLDRAKQTAEIISKKHPTAKIEFSDKLKEKDAGVFAGRPGDEMINACQTSGLPFGEFQPEGGESWYQAGERVVGFVEEIINKYKNTDMTILLVGHGSIFTYMLMWADKFDPQKNTKEIYDYYHPANTAVAIIEVNQEGEPILVSLNDTSHL